MAILMHCTCGTKLTVDDSMAGKKVRCPRCQAVLVAPAKTAPVSPVVEPKAPAAMPTTKPAPPEEEPILGIILGLDDQEKPTKKKAQPADEPILGIVLDPPRPKKKARLDDEPVRTARFERKRPPTRPVRPKPAVIWPWVVAGVTGACLLIGTVITLIIVLNDSGDRRVVKEGKKDPFWAKKDREAKKEEAKKDPFWDAKKEEAKKIDAFFDEKKAWFGDKKGDDKFFKEPFRPVAPIIANLVDGKYQHAGSFLPGERTDPNRIGKIYQVRLQANRTYVIDLISNQFDAYLFLLDMDGRQLAFDDDGGDGLNARIKYKIPRNGTYKIIATSLGGLSTGNYTFSIRDEEVGEAIQVAKLPDLVLPKSTSPKEALAVQPLQNNQVSLTRVLSADLIGDMCWSKDGKAFFTLQPNGILRRIALTGFAEQKRLDTARRCSWLAMSGEGLIVTLPELEEAWLIDPDSLEVKKRVSAPKAQRVLSAPAAAIAVVVANENRFDPFNRGALTVLDLKKGEPVAQFALPGQHATMSPDGKYLFSQGGIEQLQRIRIEGKQLIQDDSSPRIAQNGQGIFVSPDSKYVCLPSGGGNYRIPGAPAGSYSTFVFPVDNLRQPAFTVASGAYPQVVGFDPKGGDVFAQDHKTALMIFDFKGQKKKEISLPIQGREVKQYLVHPDGGKLLVRSDKQLLFVDLSGRKPDPKVVEESFIKLKNGMAEIQGRLTLDSEKKFGKAQQDFAVEMLPGREYALTLKSKYLNGSLLLMDAATKQQVSGVTGFAGKDARCLFRPTKAGTYIIRVVNRTFNAIVEGKSDFTVTIEEKLIPVDKKDPDPKVAEAIKLTDGKFATEGRLSDPKSVFGKSGKEYVLETRAGFEYWIEMKSENFDPFITVRDAGGKPLTAGGSKARAITIFRPTAPGTYRILASTTPGKAAEGAFTLNISERIAAKVEAPLPPGEIAGKPEVEDGLSVRRLVLGTNRPPACWDDQGKFLFAFNQLSGQLSRIRVADFKVEASAKHVLQKTSYQSLFMSAEGLVLSDSRRILLIDPSTLNLKKAFQVPTNMQVVTSSGASLALGIMQIGPARNRDVLFDLKGLTQTPLAGLPAGNLSAATGKCLSPDGKTFFLVPAQGVALQRYRLQNARLELEEETKISLRIPTHIAMRADGKYVIPYSSSSFGPATEVGVFESARLAKPAFTLPATTKAVCFLQPGGHIVAFSGADLEVYSDAGVKIKSFPWLRGSIINLVPHATRPAALVIAAQGVYYLELTDLKIAGK